MADFQRINLSLDHYSWDDIPSNDPRVSGEPEEATSFDPKQGNEVLYMLNTVLSASAPITALHKGEELIRDELPTDTRDQFAVKKWLDAHL
ncbi:hypothetical protein ACGK9R_12705 [Halomonas sp. HNIBRBA4712]|uniref:hypothetical protein n=1 Tax=Halomonas sp. HNIBRBA4712 TaxID=3373087 RepID=UPI003746D282